MTTDEKRQQKAMLMLEHHEAQENLAHLKEKARRIGDDIREVGTWLYHAGDQYVFPAAVTNDDAKRDTLIRANLDTYRKKLNFDEAVALMEEIKGADKTLRELEQRKKDLGLQ